MKFFISGQIDDAENVQAQISAITEAGHKLTHDWTATDTFLGSREAKLSNPDETSIRAEKDMQGVVDCDIYVLSSNNMNVGKGMYVELGAAIALNVATGKPKVYIIGDMNHLSVFYLHPVVTHKESITEVIKDVAL